MANTRMKDYFDLWFLSRHAEFEGNHLKEALRATFDRRRTALTGDLPLGLTTDFAQDMLKQSQWKGFLRKNRLDDSTLKLTDVITSLQNFLLPVMMAANRNAEYAWHWPAGGPWSQ